MLNLRCSNRGVCVALLITSALLAAGCGASSVESAGADGKPAGSSSVRHEGAYPYRIVTTTGMVADLVGQVAGDKGTVIGLLGSDVDPHLYKPTRETVTQLLGADIVFYSGLGLEGRMGDTFAKVARSGKPVFAVTEGLSEDTLREPPEFEGHYDPHVWMSVKAWSSCAQFVGESLAQFDPANAAYYRDNAQKYQEELTRLDEYVRQAIESIPQQQRVLITAHDAFGYFSDAYGIAVKSPQGVSTESEASINDINTLVRFIVENKVGAIFIESSVNPKNINAIIEGAAAASHTIKIGGELYSDAMGKPGTYEGTYVGMIDHNATTIARALGGQAPTGGFQGKLTHP